MHTEPDDQTRLGVVKRFFALIRPNERRLIYFVFVLRVCLVSLDLAGLALLGVSATILAGTQINPDTFTGYTIKLVQNFGLGQVYAVFSCVAVLFFLLKGVFSIATTNWLLTRVAELETRKAVTSFIAVTHSSLDNTQKFSKHELAKGLLEGFEQSISRLVMAFSIIISESILLIAISIYLLLTDALLFGIFACFFASMALSMNFFVGMKSRKAAGEIHVKSLQAEGVVFDALTNGRQITSLGAQDFFVQRFEDYRKKMAMASAMLSGLTVLPRYVTEITLVLGFGVLIVLRSTFGDALFSASTIAVFVAGSFRIISSLLPLQGASTMLKQISSSTTLALAIQDNFPTRMPVAATSHLKSLTPDIKFSDVSFSYSSKGKKILVGFTETINFGEYLVISGPSGSGKSTMADLVLGLRLPEKGQVTIGGIAADEFVNSNPGVVGYVPQETQIFSGTLLQNVTMSESPSAIEESAALELLDRLQLSSLVSDLPDGINTQVGETFRQLSGGQRQRIGLARALFRRPLILVLDESTSALDKESERTILDLLESLRGKLTVLAIAHRGAVISRAEREIRLG
jgi:ABC-type multidrug transport system fused ATPase/permease subunit